MKPGRPIIQTPKGYKPPALRKAVGKVLGDYMDNVIFLKDLEGNVLFRGTRRECAQYAQSKAYDQLG